MENARVELRNVWKRRGTRMTNKEILEDFVKDKLTNILLRLIDILPMECVDSITLTDDAIKYCDTENDANDELIVKRYKTNGTLAFVTGGHIYVFTDILIAHVLLVYERNSNDRDDSFDFLSLNNNIIKYFTYEFSFVLLHEIYHIIEIENMSSEEFTKWLIEFDYESGICQESENYADQNAIEFLHANINKILEITLLECDMRSNEGND